MALRIQNMADNEKQIDLSNFPVLHNPSEYSISKKTLGITQEDKLKFLEVYYQTGNFTKASKVIGRNPKSLTEQLKTDAVFASDYLAVKKAIQNDLEEVMTSNARTPRGYMDRITWLRANAPEVYSPERQASDAPNMDTAIKQLAEKLKEYNLVPKQDIVDVEPTE